MSCSLPLPLVNLNVYLFDDYIVHFGSFSSERYLRCCLNAPSMGRRTLHAVRRLAYIQTRSLKMSWDMFYSQIYFVLFSLAILSFFHLTMSARTASQKFDDLTEMKIIPTNIYRARCRNCREINIQRANCLAARILRLIHTCTRTVKCTHTCRGDVHNKVGNKDNAHVTHRFLRCIYIYIYMGVSINIYVGYTSEMDAEKPVKRI